MKKVAIVGAGPAGLFAAYELAGKVDVHILERGKPMEKRKCPGEKFNPRKCIEEKCKLSLCTVNNGEGGAGGKSDGKIIFDTEIGSRLNEVDGVGPKKNQELVDRVEEIFKKFDVHKEKRTKQKEKQIKILEAKASKAGMRSISTQLAHVGTDKLPELIIKFRNHLIEQSVKISTDTSIEEIKRDGKGFYLTGKNFNERYDKVIIAPGREGSDWLEKIVKTHNIKFDYNPMDLGVRIEVKKEIADPITNLVRDMKFYIETSTYRDIVRTFCTCPGGKVARETHKKTGLNLVNGQSEKGDKHENTNFAFLVTIPFTDPMVNSNEYARLEAEKLKKLGGGKPLLQRLGDLRNGRRSKEKDILKYLTKPSLEDVTFGDIGLGLSYRHVLNLLEGLNILDKIMPGVANDGTLLYAPEAKLYSLRVVPSDPYLQTSIPGLYAIGDGAGLSKSIVGAAACGVLAAEGILKDIKG